MSTIENLAVNTIRMLAVDGVQKANSGHPGMPMGAAAMGYVLWKRSMKHNPRNPLWPDRDRFILSAGHGSMLLYSLLHLTGYDLSLDDLMDFRQWGSRTPGHPENHLTPGVEVTTGPLGQGISNAVGMAIAEAHLAAVFNRPDLEIVDHFTYVIASDGDLMEGVASEACSLAGHLGLGKLVVLYDDNHISIDGSTDLAFTEDSMARFAAYGWHTQEVSDGNDIDAIESAVDKARGETGRPSIIAVRTHIGFGSPNKQDTSGVHGSPLGEDEIRLTRQNLGWPLEAAFTIPDEVKAHFAQVVHGGEAAQTAWEEIFAGYERRYPDLAAQWRQMWSKELPDGWEDMVPDLSGEAMATRAASGKVINALAPALPRLLGGSADLAPSNNTFIKGEPAFSRHDRAGRNFHFGVREHGMAAMANGMALHGALHPYVGTFLIFSDYMKPSMRLSALSGANVTYILTHDSIGLGEDGPTHQPVEQLASIRSIPGFVDLRPADAAETAEAWKISLQLDGPAALVLTRQTVQPIDRSACPPASSIRRGAYVLAETGNDRRAIIIASGSEVGPALGAMKLLDVKGIHVRVVNMASFELFERQSEAYRREVLPPELTARVAVEAASPFGWDRYTGSGGKIIGINRFGSSAPGGTNMVKFGFTAENIARTVEELLQG
ncbi:MAG: transketolase [bacterium]|nr:transketolase [bacterium]MDT8395299.1 transketolase [bacterium]